MWAMTVFGNRDYIIGAETLAYTIRRHKSKYDILLCITADIREFVTRPQLFTHIVVVPYLQSHSTPRLSGRQKEVYSAFIRNTPTKFGAIKAASELGYKKVLMLDVDMIFVTNCDELFNLEAPATCWGMPLSKDKSGNKPITPNIDALNLKTGDKIRAADIHKTFRGSFCCWGSMMLMEASEKAFEDIMSNIGSDFSSCYSGPEEQMFAMYCEARGYGTAIGHEFNRIPWKKYAHAQGKIRILHYHSSKPWAIKKDEWPDLAIWHDMHDAMQSSSHSLDLDLSVLSIKDK